MKGEFSVFRFQFSAGARRVGQGARAFPLVAWFAVVSWGGLAAEVPVQLRPDRVDQMIAKGVAFLVRSQQADGMIQVRDKAQQHGAAMTGLSLMALAAVGHQPVDKTPEGEAMRRALGYLLRPDAQSVSGYFGQRDGSRMYGHGIITLALTELLGMGVDKAQDGLLRERAQRGVNLILAAQRVKKYDGRFIGGWRYSPDAGDADLSVTVWQLLALRSAKNAGLVVPKEAIDAAVGYLRRSYASGRDAQGQLLSRQSAFGYVPGQPPQYAMAAAGLLAMQVCGLPEAPEALGAAGWVRTGLPDWGTPWVFYGTYYFAQASHKRGGEVARVVAEHVGALLLAHQQADGAWLGADGSEGGEGPVYGTALALLALSVRYHYLPIYQD